MSSINPDSRPIGPRPPKFEESTEGLSEARREHRGFPPGEGRPDAEFRLPRDEFRAGPRPHGPHHPPHGGRGPGFGPMERPAPPEPGAMAEHLFTQADADGDGVLTKAELTAHFQARVAEQRPADAVPEQALATEPTAELVSEVPETASSVSDILVEGLAVPVTEEATAETLAPADVQAYVLAWLEAIAQDPQFAEASEEQQAQLQAAYDAVASLDPADAQFTTSLQEVLQAFGLAE